MSSSYSICKSSDSILLDLVGKLLSNEIKGRQLVYFGKQRFREFALEEEIK